MSKLCIKVFLILLIITNLAACTSKSENTSKEISIEEINKKITQVVDISELTKGDENKLDKLYGIKKENIEDFVLYLPPSNIEASELLLIKVKDKTSIDSIKEKIAKRVEKKSEIFKDYLPEEYYLVEKHVLDSKNQYILFSIHKEGNKVQKAFDESF